MCHCHHFRGNQILINHTNRRRLKGFESNRSSNCKQYWVLPLHKVFLRQNLYFYKKNLSYILIKVAEQYVVLLGRNLLIYRTLLKLRSFYIVE